MPNIETETNVLAATWSTAMVDALPDSSFAFVDGKTRKLPYKDASGKVDLPHVRNALARLNQTQGIPDDQKAAIKTKLQNALKTNTKAADDVRLSTIHNIEADATTNELPTKMMLLRSGIFDTQKYGEVPLSASDLTEMKANFDNGVGMVGDGSTGIPLITPTKAAKMLARGSKLWKLKLTAKAMLNCGPLTWNFLTVANRLC